MFLSAFASLRSDPVSRAYYQRKRDQGKPPWARPSSPWPTAARHTTQRHPRLVTWMYTRTGTIEGRTAIAVDIAR